MQALSQSAFLQALGYAIANSLWQAALLWALTAISTSVIKMPSQVKYKVALVAQLGVFVWFVITLQFYYVQCSRAVAQLQSEGLANGNAVVLNPGLHSFAAAMLSAILKGETLLPYLSIAYLCLLVAMAVRWVKGYRQTILIKTTGLQKIDVEWRLFVKNIAGMLGIKKPVHIYISDLVKSPLTIGFLKPVILVPMASINNLTTYQLEAVLLHELAHIHRADYVINIIQSIIETALFFNPFTQLLSKIIRRERENACDDWVLQFKYEPATYAEALLRIAYLQQEPALAMAAAGKETDLLWRVKRMLNQQQKTFQYRNRLFALLMITGMLTSIAWLRPAVKTETAQQVKSSEQPVVVEPLATQIDNPWFNPMSFINKPLQEEVDKAVSDAKASMKSSSQLAIQQAGNALEKVTPEALESIKNIHFDIPALQQAAVAGVKAADDQNAVGNVNINLKGLGDSLNIGNLVSLALNEGLKNVDVKQINLGLAQGQQELKKALGSKEFKEAVNGTKVKDVVLKSLTGAANSIFKVSVNGDDADKDDSKVDDNDGDGGGSPTGGRSVITRSQKVRQRALLQARKTDSLRKVYSYLNNFNTGTGKYSWASTPAPLPYYSSIVAAPASYNKNADDTTDYIPVKFDQDVPFNVSLGKANADLSVTARDNATLVAVREDDDTDDTYKKHITIETLDSGGQKHIYHITIEMYQ